MLWVALHLPSLPAGTLETIAAWACQFTPKVSLEPPHALLAEVQGSLRYFDGLGNLLAKLRAGLAELGIEASLAVAGTPRAALWRARGGGARLEALPVAAMNSETGFFESIGISTIGELLRLPREGLAKRCSRQLLEDLDRAFGRLPEPRAFYLPPARFAAGLELPVEVVHAEGLLFAARRLLLQLEGLLLARQAGIRGFTLILLQRAGKSTAVEIHLASPARDTERLSQLLRERLAALPLAHPVEAMRLEAGQFTPLHARSAGMFGDAAAEEEGWAQLVERLRLRLGHEAVYGITTHPDHRPEYAWRRVEPGEWDPRAPHPHPGPRPLWLLEPARRIDEAQFELLAGPERIESGWWDGDDAKRDYFVARAAGSSLMWLYREAGEWFVHGIFA